LVAALLLGDFCVAFLALIVASSRRLSAMSVTIEITLYHK
jgi:hypothetical protein